jgi:hypothetical protein
MTRIVTARPPKRIREPGWGPRITRRIVGKGPELSAQAAKRLRGGRYQEGRP